MSTDRPIFTPLPPKQDILRLVELHRRNLNDPLSYLWYIAPVADRFGDRVFDVAADSLTQSGIQVTSTQLRQFAEELRTPEGMGRYAENKRRHIDINVTSYKTP